MLHTNDLINKARPWAFTTLVGSHNYNLNTENSDKDYKAFFYPLMIDLYHNFHLSHQSVGEEFDMDRKDVRLLYALLTKANPSYIEILYSVEYQSNDMLYNQLVQNRDNIIMCHLDSMIKSSIGTIKKNLDGSTNKRIANAYRIMVTLKKFFDRSFRDFDKCIYFDNDDKNRDIILSIKQNKVSEKSLTQFKNVLCSFVNDHNFINNWYGLSNEMSKGYREKCIKYNDTFPQYSHNVLLHDLLYNAVSNNVKSQLNGEFKCCD